MRNPCTHGVVMPLSLVMAWRETRGSWRRFVVFLLCVAVGVAAVTGIDLCAANVEGVILKDARSLLGGDVEIRAPRDLGASGNGVVAALRERRIDVTHVRELVGMAAARPRASRSTQLVEIKAVDERYPLYGRVGVSPDRPLNALLASAPTCPDVPAFGPCFGIVVQKSLLIVLGLDVGAPLKIGQAWFEIRGVLRAEPDRAAGAFSLGPRVMMSRAALSATDLVQAGSRVRQRYLLRVPESLALDPLLAELQDRLADEGARVSSFRNARPRIRTFLDQFTVWLGLIALTALFVGGLGIACVMHGFITHKLTTVAILKTLGADAGFIMRVYLGQSGILGCVGSLIGVAGGAALQLVLPAALGGLLPVAVGATVTAMPLIKGLVLGLGTTLCFAVRPLLAIRAAPPALVFRRDVDERPAPAPAHSFRTRAGRALRRVGQDRQRLLADAVTAAGLLALAVWQARSALLGAVFLLAFGAALVLLHTGVRLLMTMLRGAPLPRAPVVRYALGRVRRPGPYTMSMAVSIGVGAMVMTTVAMVKADLLSVLGDRIPDDAPTFFFVDIQPDQIPAFERIVRARTPTAAYALTPVARSRLGALNGAPVNPNAHADARHGWYFTREYALTESADLPGDNVIVNGHWWPPAGPDHAPSGARRAARVSVEEEAARVLGLEVGSTVEFDVQGAPLPAVVGSIRKVDWGSFSTNFYMILSPASLSGAPLTYIATATVGPDEAVPLQQALVRALPNVTAIQIGDVLANVARLLEQLARVIQGMALVCIISGAVVMAAALSSTRHQRLYEAAVLKVVGGTRRMLTQSFALECAVVGALAGAIGVGLATALSWAIVNVVLDVPWTWQPGVTGWALAATVGLAVAVGCSCSWRILGRPPLSTLRRE